MTDLDVAGRVESALTHFALLGAAAILRDGATRGVAIWFADEDVARPRMRFDGVPLDVARAIRSHAVRASNGWIAARTPHEGAELRGTLSPRLKAPSTAASWQSLQHARWRELDRLTRSREALDLALIGGLGEPAYWPSGAADVQPDRGASRWEMKTRNRGEEFVADRLYKLGVAVAERTEEAVLAGVSGDAVVDETGGKGPDSRTATGFARPGPVDSALAWCALWGIASFPVTPKVGSMSQTPGSFPRDRVHPRVMVLPVFDQPTSPLRTRAVMRSSSLDAYTKPDKHDLVGPRRWLVEHGVAAIARFPVDVTGSSSAPERQILDGELELLR